MNNIHYYDEVEMEKKILSAERFVDMETGCSYRYVNSRTEHFRPHMHDYCEIFIMLDGNAMHTANGKERRLTTGDTVFIRPDDYHDYAPIDERPFNFLNLTFTKETLDSLFSYLSDGYDKDVLLSSPQPPTVRLSHSAFSEIERDMERIRAIAPEATDKRKTAIRILLMNLFVKVFTEFEPEEELPAWLSEVCEKMKHEGNFPFGISRMVELSGKSREHLTRSMRKCMGLSPSEFVNDLRLNYIANMLRNSNHSVLDIIFDSGFNTVSHASTLFREKYGMSMSEFRKR